MTGGNRGATAIVLLLTAVLARGGGTTLVVLTAYEILGAGIQLLSALLSYVPFLSEPDPRPLPPFDVLAPALVFTAGVLVFCLGWIALITGTTRAWPRRFDRSTRQ